MSWLCLLAPHGRVRLLHAHHRSAVALCLRGACRLRCCRLRDSCHAVALRAVHIATLRPHVRIGCPCLRHQRLCLRVQPHRHTAQPLPAARREPLCLRSPIGGALVSSAPTEQKCTVYLVGAAETAAPPEEGTNRAMPHATKTILPQIAQIYTDSLGA